MKLVIWRRAVSVLIAVAIILVLSIARARIAHAALPGQPGGIPEQANSFQWRFATGNVCIEDLTGGYWTDGLKHAAAEYSGSSDLNVSYRLDCQAAGFPQAQTITAVRNSSPCTNAIGAATIWTQGGLSAEGYTVTWAKIEIFTDCYTDWYASVKPPTATELLEQKRGLAAHEAGHVFGFEHQQSPACSPPYSGEWWLCRPDTVMNVWEPDYPGLTAWDYWRLDVIYPW